MKKLIYILILFIIPVSFLSCETDFDVIADYKEVAIVYGLLNQNDPVHYLRINKAFLGEGNALTYAQVADSSSFGADITVVLTETTPGGAKRDIVFDTVTLSNKEPGDFYSPDQLFYASSAKLNEKNAYTLTITNKKSGYVANSQTLLIHNFDITTPLYRPPPLPPVTLSFRRAVTSLQRFVWKNAVNGKRYQFRLFFNYKELMADGDTTHRKSTWVFPVVDSETTTGNGDSFVTYFNEDFYIMCESSIPYSDKAEEDAVIKRFASVCDLEVTAVGDEFTTYLDANGPSTGLIIDKPTYSNITNGVGLFSCRYQIHRLMNLSPETIFDLSTTTDLKFAKLSK